MLLVLLMVLGWSHADNAWASIVNEPMTDATAPGWVIGGTAFLTASTGVDPVGSGWLRLTDPGNDEAGFAFLDTPFDISQGAVIQFDYATWGGTGADGYSIYLFDGSYNSSTFSVGASGGSLGYAQKTVAPLDPGLSGGYIGVGIDEFGNYSNPTEGRIGGPGAQVNEVGVRGPYNHPSGAYYWLGGSGSLAQSLAFNNQGYRPIQTGSQYRKVIIYLTPVAAPNYLRVDTYLQFGYNQPLTPVVTNLMVGRPVPASVKIGYAASTGGSTNYHEIRNLVVDPLQSDINLGISKLASSSTATAGGPIGYTITVRNYGPNNITATNVPIVDTFPSELTGVSWTCTGSNSGTCGAASGSGNINTTATLPFNGSATYTVSGTVSPATAAGTLISNTASLTVPAGITDYNPADNSASATVSVTAAPVTLSGMVYNDANHNGVRDAGENAPAGINNNLYAKLFRSSDLTTALSYTTVASAGTFTFANVPSYDTYTIILSTNTTLTDPTPAYFSTQWIYTSPANYTLANIVVGNSNVSGQNFGVYNGSRITGKVINDNGLNGAIGNANDGILNAAETGIAGVTVRLTNNTGGTTYDTTTTGTGGDFMLFTNTGSTTLRIYETNSAGYVSVSFNHGTTGGTYTIGGEYISFTYTQYTDYSGVLFGDVPDNTFTPTPQSKSGSALAPVYYAHTFTPGSGGSVTFAVNSQTQTWTKAFYQDTNCNGTYDAGTDTLISGALTASAGTNICILLQETIPAGAANGATDVVTTRATFTFTNSVGPVVQTYNVTDTTTVQASDLSTSTKTWTDPNGGDQNPGDVIPYTITLIETAGVAASGVTVTDTFPATLTGLAVTSCPSGATCTITGQVLTVSNASVAASGTAAIVVSTTIAGGTAVGTLIDNCSTITNPAGVGASPCASTITVSQSSIPVTGNKPLYLYGAGGGAPGPISRLISGNTSNITITARTSAQTWTQDIAMQLPMTLNPASNNVAINLYMSCTNARTGNVRVDLTCGAISLTQTKRLTFAVGGTVYPQTFNLPYTPPQTCAQGNKWTLTITNTGINNALTVYPVSGGNRSYVNLPSASVIHVDSVNAYNAAYPAVTTPASGYYTGGQTVYVRPAVSDPFGAFDISSATITIKDPNNNTIVSAATLTNIVTSTTGTNTYEYAYTVPATGPTGYWTVNITANEGSEGTVSDLGTGTFHVVLLPSIMVVKSSTVISDPVNGVSASAKAIPGAEVQYTIQVINNGSGVADADSIVITDVVPANMTMYVDTAGSALTFSCSGCGLTTPWTYGSAVSYSYQPGGGPPYVYPPTTNGYDPLVTGVRIAPSGTLNGGGANFIVQLKMRIN